MPSFKEPLSAVQPGGATGLDDLSLGSGSNALPTFGGGPPWADGTTNPATSVSGQLTKTIDDLSSLVDGSAKIGSPDLPGTSNTIGSGTLLEQLLLLKEALYHEYTGGAVWADGTTNPATNVETQLDKIITDLVATAGSARIGAAAIVGAGNTIAAGTIRSQLVALKQAANIEYTGGGTWADGSTNPATLIETQLDKIVTDLSGTAGTAKIGSADIVGASSTIVAGTLLSQLTALKNAAQLDYGGGTAWADGLTNSATTVEGQIDKILTDLSGQGGSAKIGSTNIVGASSTIVAGTLLSQLTALKSASNLDLAVRSAWLGGRTNPASTLFAGVDKIITDLAVTSSGDDGMERIGGQSVAGSPNSLTSGSARSQANELLGFVNAFAGVGGTDGMTLVGGKGVSGSPYSLTQGTARSQADELLGYVNVLAGSIPLTYSSSGDDGDASPPFFATFNTTSYVTGLYLDIPDTLVGDVINVRVVLSSQGDFAQTARVRLQYITGYGGGSPSSQTNISGAVTSVNTPATSSVWFQTTLQGSFVVDRVGTARLCLVGKVFSTGDWNVRDYSFIAELYRP